MTEDHKNDGEDRLSLSERLMTAFAPILAALVIRILKLTMRTRYVGFDRYRELCREGRQVILAFWHGRLLMMPYSHLGSRGITVLVSRSKDGELIARTVRAFGIESVRGSSSRGWLGGLKGLLKAIGSGRDVAITPDGPRGPGMEAQSGIIQVAARTGLPIIPMAFGASKKKYFPAGTASSCRYPSPAGYSCAVSP